MCRKCVNLVDLVKSFPTNIFLQNLASIQKRTSPLQVAHLAEKSENGSVSNLLTKVPRGDVDGDDARAARAHGRAAAEARGLRRGRREAHGRHGRPRLS